VSNLERVFMLYLAKLLTPWSKVFLKKLDGPQLVKKFPAFYGNRNFVTAFTSARHLSLPKYPHIHKYPHITKQVKITMIQDTPN